MLLETHAIAKFRGAPFGRRTAHKWLSKVRKNAACEAIEVVDLTGNPEWRQYVCSHPHANDIIGSSGVVKFEGRFLDTP